MDVSSTLPPLAKHPSIDVVVPTRDRAHFLSACLDSVRLQTLQPSRVLVVDDGSVDDTGALLAGYASRWPLLHIIETSGAGVSAARNRALAGSNADLIAFIDSDDVWDPGLLAALTARFTSGTPQLGFVNCGLRQIDAVGAPLRDAADVVPSQRGHIFHAILERFYGIAPSTLMVRRDVLLAVGGFDESLTQAEDRDLCLKLARVSEADYVPDILVGLREHERNSYGSAMRREPETVLFQRLRVWNKWLAETQDIEAVLTRFRREAVATGVFLFRRLGVFGLHKRLRKSDLALARMLFPRRLDYVRAVVAEARAMRPQDKPSPLQRLKLALVRRVVVQNAWLLRLAQMFGRLKGLEPRSPTRRARGNTE